MKFIAHFILLLLSSTTFFGQSLDDTLSIKKMKIDLEVFKKIRFEANSGLYKYRTKDQIDSCYHWAFKEIEQPRTYIEFYSIICALTDFEGSLHNDTSLPDKVYLSMKKESSGYFPYPLKLIEGKLLMNFETTDIPLGAEIIAINNHSSKEILHKQYKYYTTDGLNITGKSIGINYNFSKYYRWSYGRENTFVVTFKPHDSKKSVEVEIPSTSFINYYKNVEKRYSKPFDEPDYKDWEENEIYSYRSIDDSTGILTVNDFNIGNESSPMHLRYVHFLDSTFAEIKRNQIKNLIVDIRCNGGGTDPNDLVTYSYLTSRNFSENKQAWISFKKFPYLKYAYTKIPRFLRPLGVWKYNRMFASEFPEEKNGNYYEDATNEDHAVRKPNKNAFDGKIYLLISPRVASAGSLFAAMVAGNENTVVVGEETMGGYYGHNGHTPIGYILPKTKINTFFSVVNLEQDVPAKKNQIYNRGILPDYRVVQTYSDFMQHRDAQLEYVLKLIKP